MVYWCTFWFIVSIAFVIANAIRITDKGSLPANAMLLLWAAMATYWGVRVFA